MVNADLNAKMSVVLDKLLAGKMTKDETLREIIQITMPPEIPVYKLKDLSGKDKK